jgi:lysozyme
MDKLEKYIADNEGLRLKPYRCSEEKLTIGYGRNLDSTGISEKEALFMLQADIEKAAVTLYGIFTFDEIESWHYEVHIALTDMVFNLGGRGFKRFKKMIKAIKSNDFKSAAREMLDSRYAKQVPNRAIRNAKQLLKGIK